MTYNIRIDHTEDQGNQHSWVIRKRMVAGLIRAYSPDFVALQEVNETQHNHLRELLPDYTFAGYPVGKGIPSEERLLFAYKPARLALNESAVFSLSPTPSQPIKAWDARYPRACVYGKFVDRLTKRFLVVLNTHLDHMGQIAREESVKLIVQLQENLALLYPRVILGDFNFYPEMGGDHLYNMMVSSTSGLYDVRDLTQEAYYGPDGSWMGWEYEKTRSEDGVVGHRIDHIFAAGAVQVIRCGVLGGTIDQSGKLIPDFSSSFDNNTRLFPADHLPVIVDVTL
ncbi:MAG: endonuclease/exonuclease/phosphatase family protein [Chlamydiales bacterium]|nr:endonuclease/exonuclease/phosphatase family protein [Chlamydiales bacterium]